MKKRKPVLLAARQPLSSFFIFHFTFFIYSVVPVFHFSHWESLAVTLYLIASSIDSERENPVIEKSPTGPSPPSPVSAARWI